MTDDHSPSAATTSATSTVPPPRVPSPGESTGRPADAPAVPPVTPPAAPPTEPSEQAAGSESPRPRRWRKVVAALAGLVVIVLLAPTPLVQPFADRAGRGYQGRCAEMAGVEVDPGAWPVVARAAAGRMRDVATHADEIRFDNGVTFHDLDFSATEVNGPPLRFGLANQDAEIRGGESSATVRLDDLERSLGDEGIAVDLHAETGSLVADVDVPVIGVVPTAVEVVPVEGDIELRYGAYDAIPLPPLRIDMPEPIEVEAVEVAEDGIRVSSTVDGVITAQDWGCATTAGTG
jgi:hypothetical protein